MRTQRKRILITVKTYPTPSCKYDELVCTAGIDMDTGKFIRLHPVRFRDLPLAKQYRKWSIIEADAFHRTSDPRGDTYSPVAETIKRVGTVDYSDTKPNWAERNRAILPLVKTVEELQESAAAKAGSLGVVRVHGRPRFTAEPDDRDWSEKQRLALTRDSLFGQNRRPLQKVPWRFRYKFECSDDCPSHRFQVLDWEAYALYLGQLWKKRGQAAAIDAVLEQYNEALSTDRRDLYVFVGTHSARRTQFMAIGIYYPPTDR